MNLKISSLYQKKYLLITIVLASILCNGCTKSNGSTPPVQMSGNFDLVSDSIHNVTQVVTIYSYKGQTGDYWNFRPDSVYTKEGQQSDTLSLRVTPDSLYISGIPYTVKSESDGNLKLQNIIPEIDFGGQYTRIIILKPSSSGD